MTGDVTRQTLAVLVAVVLVLFVVGTWMVMSSHGGQDVDLSATPTATGTIKVSFDDGTLGKVAPPVTGQVVLSYNDN